MPPHCHDDGLCHRVFHCLCHRVFHCLCHRIEHCLGYRIEHCLGHSIFYCLSNCLSNCLIDWYRFPLRNCLTICLPLRDCLIDCDSIGNRNTLRTRLGSAHLRPHIDAYLDHVPRRPVLRRCEPPVRGLHGVLLDVHRLVHKLHDLWQRPVPHGLGLRVYVPRGHLHLWGHVRRLRRLVRDLLGLVHDVPLVPNGPAALRQQLCVLVPRRLL